MMTNVENDKLNEFVDYLIEAFFSAVNVEETPKQKPNRKPTPLDEINWQEPDIANVSSRCMSIQQVADFFNSELDRWKAGEKRNPNMPNIAKGVILGKEEEIDVKEFARKLSMPPKTIFDKGEKSKHSVDTNTMTINTGIPALRGLVWDKENNEFRVINTCPGAGKCAIDCYALQGFYIFNDGKNLKLAQRLQMIFQDPEAYFIQGIREAEMYAFEANRDNKVLEIRWNDAGDFFSERYLKLAVRITKSLLEKKYKVKSYFYTKVGGMVELGQKLGFTVTWSQGGVQQVENPKKQSIIVPVSIVKNFVTKFKGRGFAKDDTGKTAVNDKEGLRKAIVNAYSKDTSIPNSNTIDVNNTKFTDELPPTEGKPGQFNAIVLPGGDTDAPAQREDVQFIFLIKH